MKFSSSYYDLSENKVEINFNLPLSSKVSLKIYGKKGDLVYQLFAHTLQAGKKCFRWNMKDLRGQSNPPGIYYYLIQVDAAYEISGEIEISGRELIPTLQIPRLAG